MNSLEGRILFLDLDGVFADFDAAVARMFGKPSEQVPRREMWARIFRTRGFWSDLAMMPGADMLWERVRRYDPVFLTGVLKGDRTCEPSKIAWVRQRFGTDRVICCMARDKPSYGKPGDILVDDRISNVDAWTAMGGHGILHRTVPDTIAELRAAGLG